MPDFLSLLGQSHDLSRNSNKRRRNFSYKHYHMYVSYTMLPSQYLTAYNFSSTENLQTMLILSFCTKKLTIFKELQILLRRVNIPTEFCQKLVDGY